MLSKWELYQLNEKTVMREGGKESEDGRGGCVVGGGSVGGRRQGRWSVRESEEGSEEE